MCNLWISKEHIKYEGVSNLGPPSALFDYTLRKGGRFLPASNPNKIAWGEEVQVSLHSNSHRVGLYV